MERLRIADIERLSIPQNRKPPGNTVLEIYNEVQNHHPGLELSQAQIQEYLNDGKYPHRKTWMYVVCHRPVTHRLTYHPPLHTSDRETLRRGGKQGKWSLPHLGNRSPETSGKTRK
jgi:hypothetical protein